MGFADRFDHVLLAKRMILGWYKQFFVFHLKIGPNKVSRNTSLIEYPRRQGVAMKITDDISDRITFTDFFRPNSLSGRYLDKLQDKQGVNMGEFTLVLEASSIFIQKDIMREIFLEMDLDERGKIDLQQLEKFAKKTELKEKSKLNKKVSILRKCSRSWFFWSEWSWFVGAIAYLIEAEYFLGSSMPDVLSRRLLTLVGAFIYFFAGLTLFPNVYYDASRYCTRIADLGKAMLELSISEGIISREDRKNQRRKKRSSGSHAFHMLGPTGKRRKSFLKRDSFLKNIFFSYDKWIRPGDTQSVKENDLEQDEENSTAVGLNCVKLHNILFHNGILIELDIFTRVFQKADINGDGNLSFEEFLEFAVELDEAKAISKKDILSEVLRRSDFYFAFMFVVAGIIKVLFEFFKVPNFFFTDVEFGEPLILALGVSFSCLYAMCASAAALKAIGNLSSKFYTMQNCKVSFCKAIIMRASKYTETIDHEERTNICGE